MKKIILLSLFALSALPSLSWAANFASISCSDARISANSAGCNECFTGGALYYRSNRAIENVTNFYDTFSVTGTGSRVMWQDETSVTWGILNSKFILGSSLSSVRSSTNGFKFQTIPGSWQTAQNAPNTGRIYGMFAAGTTTLYVQSPGGISLDGVANNITPSDRNTAMWKITFNASSHNYIGPGQQGPLVNHYQCAFLFGNWCGDGVVDSGKGEQCDDGNMNSGDGCSNVCQTEITPVCTGLTVSPTSLTNGGMVTYTCSGTNATSYSIIAKNPSGAIVASSTNAVGSLTLPAAPVGTYNVECYINNQVSTPDICKKTVTNTTVEPPVCTGLTVTPNSLTNGGGVSYTCTGNNVTSYSVAFTKPDGSALQTLSTATGSVTIPATPTGTYTARCYVNGQGYALDVCTKSITNNGTTPNPQILIDKRDANSADLDGNIGGNDSQTVYSGNTAVFKIRVTNTGTEDLKNIVLSDSVAPNCADSMTLPSTIPGTWSGFVVGGAGNHADAFLQPNEYFEYTCDKGNTTINYTNTARVDALGKDSNIAVNSTDPTPVILQNVVNPTCDNLTLSTSGNIINYVCSGSNASSYRMELNGSQISTSATGSVQVGNGTHTLVCYVNNSISSQSCQKSVTINPEVTHPRIEVVKDDNDNRDDQQQLQTGGLAQFSILVRNPGPEPLDNITLSDQFAPECNRNPSETLNMVLGVGNRDGRLDPGESFTYVCNRPGADQSTFPNNENRVCTSGRGTTSGNTVSACDITRVYFGSTPTTCQNIQIGQNGNQMNVTCSPQGGYRLFLMQNGQVVNSFQNPAGQFSFGTNPGTYTVVCLRDGDNTVQPNCQRNITVRENRPEGVCTLQSSAQYGGAPLYTNLSCRSTTGSQQCMIKIHKDGFLWKTLYACDTALTMTERGVYDATCYLGDGGEDGCRTTIQVDVMTEIPTGPFLSILILTALTLGFYITYRRRKTV